MLCQFAVYARLVLATGPGNLPAVPVRKGETVRKRKTVRKGKTVRFRSSTVQKPDPLLHCGPHPALYRSFRRFCRVWLDQSGRISSSAFRVYLCMVAFWYPTVNCKLLTMVLHCHFLMYWQPLYSEQVERRSLPHPENERQSSVNNLWSCILGNLCGAWSHASINKWLAAIMSKSPDGIPAIASWTVTTYFIYKGATKCSRAF